MNKTPLWLDLRKEYIDDNFEKLLDYLKNCENNSQDSFYHTTLDLLKSRIEDLVQSQADKKLYDDADNQDIVVFHSRLLACYLLLERDTPLALSAYVALMCNLRILEPKFSDEILRVTLKRLQYENVVTLSYSWKDVQNWVYVESCG